MDKLRRKAKMFGACDLQKSNRKNKKYVVDYCGSKIHFGDSRYESFDQHKDKKRRASYLKRARGIRDKEGRLTYRNKNKSNFWSVHLLWD